MNRNPFVIPIDRMGGGEVLPAGAPREFSPLTPSAHERCYIACGWRERRLAACRTNSHTTSAEEAEFGAAMYYRENAINRAKHRKEPTWRTREQRVLRTFPVVWG